MPVRAHLLIELRSELLVLGYQAVVGGCLLLEGLVKLLPEFAHALICAMSFLGLQWQPKFPINK